MIFISYLEETKPEPVGKNSNIESVVMFDFFFFDDIKLEGITTEYCKKKDKIDYSTVQCKLGLMLY